MFALIWAVVVLALKVLGLTVAAYIFYWRVWDYFLAVYFYKK